MRQGGFCLVCTEKEVLSMLQKVTMSFDITNTV